MYHIAKAKKLQKVKTCMPLNEGAYITHPNSFPTLKQPELEKIHRQA